LNKFKKHEYRQGKRVIVAWIDGDTIRIEEYIDGKVFATMPLPKKLMESVLNE